jgi:hypothetical protein
LKLPWVVFEHVAEVDATVADLRADVVVEVHRAIQIEVQIMRLITFVDVVGILKKSSSPVIEMFGTTYTRPIPPMAGKGACARAKLFSERRGLKGCAGCP